MKPITGCRSAIWPSKRPQSYPAGISLIGSFPTKLSTCWMKLLQGKAAGLVVPQDLKELEAKVEELKIEKEAAIKNEEFEKAASLRDQEQKLRDQLEEIRSQWKSNQGRQEAVVDEQDIADVVASWTGIPVKQVAQEESQRLLNLEEILHQRVVAQDEAIEALSKAIRRAFAGLKDPKRPVGSFIFLGPTGVGKSELAKALAEALFGDEDAMVRIDMSEYMERHSVSRLVGALPDM